MPPFNSQFFSICVQIHQNKIISTLLDGFLKLKIFKHDFSQQNVRTHLTHSLKLFASSEPSLLKGHHLHIYSNPFFIQKLNIIEAWPTEQGLFAHFTLLWILTIHSFCMTADKTLKILN